MKFAQVGVCFTLVVSLVSSYSFSDITTVSPPPPASVSNERAAGIDMTADEENRIFGGSTAETGKYPFMVGLRANGTSSEVFCGGTLIAPQFVLTAGHCLEWALDDVYASLGTEHRTGPGPRKSEQIRVVEAFRHPKYNLSISYLDSTTFLDLTHDMAVLKLEKPSTYQPAVLPSADGSDDEPGTTATALGWGFVNNISLSETLQAADVEIMLNEKCKELLAREATVDESIICAGTGDGKDACGGDSGGPLAASGVLVGVVSAGSENCGRMPGLYASVSNALDFIKDIMDGGSSGNATEMLTAGTSIFTNFAVSASGSGE